VYYRRWKATVAQVILNNRKSLVNNILSELIAKTADFNMHLHCFSSVAKWWFLPRDATPARYMLCPMSVHHIRTVSKQLTSWMHHNAIKPNSRPGTSFLVPKHLIKFQWGYSHWRYQIQVGGKISECDIAYQNSRPTVYSDTDWSLTTQNHTIL